MATASTRSSGTDGPDPEETSGTGPARRSVTEPDASAAPASLTDAPVEATSRPTVDTERRAFFFQFGRQAVSAVGQVAGMADAASRTASAMAGELLGLDEPGPGTQRGFTRAGPTTDPIVSAAAPAADDVFHSAYRVAGDELVLLDQRRIPEAVEEVVARRGSDVAYYLRLGVCRGGPLLAQVAAYGLALTAAERAAETAEIRANELRRTRQALVEARPSARLTSWALDRLDQAADRLPVSASGAEVAAALRAEADAIAGDLTAWQASIAVTLAAALPTPEERPLGVLLHGSQGALAGGQLGAGVAALAAVAAAGQDLRVYVTEGRPFMDGARLAAWELRQAGIEHRLVADSAVAWLLAREPVDAVLIAAEWSAVNGDVSALVGSRAVALLAHAADVPVIVHGPSAVTDPDTPDGDAIPEELRPARELSAYLRDVPVRVSDALVPAADIIPAMAVATVVTEHGATRAGAA